MKEMFENAKLHVCNSNGVATSVVQERPSRVIDIIATNVKLERVTSEVTEDWKPLERKDEERTREKAIRKGAKRLRSQHSKMHHRPVHTTMTWKVQKTKGQDHGARRKSGQDSQ